MNMRTPRFHSRSFCRVRHIRRRERGQATVEFVLISLILVFFLMLAWQMSWAGVQKWYFNYTASYAARAWSVYPTDDRFTPQDALLKAQSLARFYHHAVASMPLVSLMRAGAPNELDGFPDTSERFGTGAYPPGILYRGKASYLGLFQPATIQSAGFDPGSSGSIYFETYVPIEHEESFYGKEDPYRFDNDRSD